MISSSLDRFLRKGIPLKILHQEFGKASKRNTSLVSQTTLRLKSVDALVFVLFLSFTSLDAHADTKAQGFPFSPAATRRQKAIPLKPQSKRAPASQESSSTLTSPPTADSAPPATPFTPNDATKTPDPVAAAPSNNTVSFDNPFSANTSSEVKNTTVQGMQIPSQVFSQKRRMKSIDFEDEIVEGINQNPFSSAVNIEQKDNDSRNRLYRKKPNFRSELRYTIREMGLLQ